MQHHQYGDTERSWGTNLDVMARERGGKPKDFRVLRA